MIKFSSPSLSKKEISNVVNTLKSSWITSGKEELSLQKKLKKIYKKKYCILFSSWTTAAYSLFLLLRKNNNNYEVILPSLSFIATANAPLLAKCKIKFVDVDKETLGLCPLKLSEFLCEFAFVDDFGRCINKATSSVIKACVPMHTFGHPCKINEISHRILNACSNTKIIWLILLKHQPLHFNIIFCMTPIALCIHIS